MAEFKVGHYYRKDYYYDGKTEYTIIKLDHVDHCNDIRGEIIATNMDCRIPKIGKQFTLFNSSSESTKIYEVSSWKVLAYVL